MIAFIRGTVAEIREDAVIVENGGIGFCVFANGRDLGQMRAGEEVCLHTYFNVREDAMQLFGFLSRDDLSVFKLLLGISGVGPKAALGVLTALSANDLRFAVLSDDVKTISGAPGIGKKTAQKMILELKDKFDLADTFENALTALETQGNIPSGSQEEAVQALTALGYSGSDALKAVRAVSAGAEMSTEELLKAALKHISF